MYENLIKKGKPEPKIEAYEVRMARLVAEYQMESASVEQLREWKASNGGFGDLAHAAWGELIRRGADQPKDQGYGSERDVA